MSMILNKGVNPKWVPKYMNGTYLKSSENEKASEIYNNILFWGIRLTKAKNHIAYQG